MKGFLMLSTFVVLKMYLLIMAVIVFLGIAKNKSTDSKQSAVAQPSYNPNKDRIQFVSTTTNQKSVPLQ